MYYMTFHHGVNLSKMHDAQLIDIIFEVRNDSCMRQHVHVGVQILQ